MKIEHTAKTPSTVELRTLSSGGVFQTVLGSDNSVFLCGFHDPSARKSSVTRLLTGGQQQMISTTSVYPLDAVLKVSHKS